MKTMQLRITLNQKSDRNAGNPRLSAEKSRNHIRNQEITLEISCLSETIKKSGNLSEIKKSILEIKWFWNLVQCFLLFVWVFVHYHRIVTKTSVRASAWIGVAVAFWNGLILWGSICLCLYPLCRSWLVNFCFIFLNSHSSELVLKYRLVSPLLIALTVVGG